MHSANVMPPTRYVLPTWRGADIPTPPTVAAYRPSARLARISQPAPSCHASNPIPSASQRRRTGPQPVVTIPDGRTRCLATSDSRLVPGLAVRVAGIHLHLAGARVQLLNLPRDLL